MTPQFKGRIKSIFRKKKESIEEKVELIPNSDKVRIVCMRLKLGKHESVVLYDFKNRCFKGIFLMDEMIEL